MLKPDDAGRTSGPQRGDGWVLEPDAKEILKETGLPVPRFATAATKDEAKSQGRTR